MKLIKLFFWINIFIFTNLFAQTGSVSGYVYTEQNEPAIGATVFISNSNLGSSCSEVGFFKIENIPVGSYELLVRSIGYEQTEIPKITIKNNENITVRIYLKTSTVEMGQVEISAIKRQPIEDARVSVLSLTPREAKFLPGKAEDVLRSLTAFPGVLAVSDFSSQLAIRGSGPDQNLISIDGFEIINPYRLYGFISMFNPETVSEISLQTGGFPVKFGDRLSAVLDVKNREGISNQVVSGKINTSITNANLIFEGSLPFDATWILSTRRTYYDLILGPIIKALKFVDGDVALPHFTDIQTKIAFPINQYNKIIFNGIGSNDAVKFMSGSSSPRPGSISIEDDSRNNLLGMTWQFTPTKNIISQTQYSWYQNQGVGAFDGTFIDPSQQTGNLEKFDTTGIRFFSFGVDYDFKYIKSTVNHNTIINFERHSFEFGGGVDYLTTTQTQYIEYDSAFKDFMTNVRRFALPTDFSSTLDYDRFNFYFQDRIQISPQFYIQPGIRFDNYKMMAKSHISPRINFSYSIDNLTTLRGAYGNYFQSPGMDKQISNQNLQYTAETFLEIDAEKATHYILGIDRMLTQEWQLKTEGYLKQFTNLIVPEILVGKVYKSTIIPGKDIYSREGWTIPIKVDGDSITRKPVNEGVGIAYGIEFFLQKTQTQSEDDITGWISYAWAVAERERDGIRTPFIYDQRHAMNIVGNYKLAENWELGINFALRSGRPYAEAIGLKPRISAKNDTILTDSKGKVILDIEYEKKTLSGRLKLYHSLDLRITTYPRWFGLPWSFYLDVTNLYNNKNEQQKSFYIDKETKKLEERITYGMPIFPAIGMSFTF
ncbi:MAG: hypothetical protein EXR16_05585 [Bacteroidetes bacterium]|nr:hypothetical protein [Bacteroidota bacterium]